MNKIFSLIRIQWLNSNLYENVNTKAQHLTYSASGCYQLISDSKSLGKRVGSYVR